MDDNKKTTLSALCGRAKTTSPLHNTPPPTTVSAPQCQGSHELLRGVFDASTQAIAVVDSKCQLAAINIAAQETIEYSNQIRVSANGELSLLDDITHAMLLDHLSKVTSGLMVSSPLALGKSACGTEPFARVSSLHTTANASQKALAMICFNSAKPAHYDHHLAWSLYNLSRAELAVSEALVSGNTVKQISTSRSTSIETVRCQLKSIFAKTQTNSQHGLVSLLLRTAALPSFR